MKKNYLNLTKGLQALFSVALFLLTGNVFGQTTQTYTSGAGTFVPPAGVTTLSVQTWGGGGGGGGSLATSANAGGGGGGGAYSINSSVTTFVSGTSYNISVGSGGNGGASGGGNGTAGGVSSAVFGITTISANGGGFGNGASGTLPGQNGTGGAGATIGVGTTVRSGGSGGTGATGTAGGGGGGSAGTGANGNNGAAGSAGGAGGAAVTGGGAGGAGGTGGANGIGGGLPGAGGGGGRSASILAGGSSRAGGAGAAGKVIITYTCVTYNLNGTSVSTPICPGQTSTVTLTSSAAGLPTGTYTVTYNRSAPNAATGLTATMTVTVAGTGSFTTGALANSGNTTITITSLASGSATGTGTLTTPACVSAIGANNTAVITVNALPSATASSSSPFCIGGNLQLNGGANGLISYQWSGPAGYSSTDQSPLRTNAVANFAGTYTITVTDNVGCTASNTTVVAQSPNINPTAGSNTPFCNGGTLSLTSSGTGAVSYLWSGPSGYSSTNQNPSITGAGSNEVGTYTITITNGNGCTASTSTTVALATTPSISASATVNPICQGLTANLTSSPSGGKTPYFYSWSTGATTQNTSVIASTTQTYTVTVTDACGISANATVLLNVNNASVSITPTPSNSVICGGGSVALTASGANTYTWTPNSQLSATAGASIVASSFSSTTYTVTGTAANGCTATASKTVTVSPRLSTVGISTPPKICPGGNATLSATATTTTNYSVSTIDTLFLYDAGATVLTLANNAETGLLPMPFNFNYWGNNITLYNIHSNGFVQMQSTAGGNGIYNQNALPTATDPNNLIAGVWTDLDPAVAPGQVSYFTQGTSPNRVLVVDYDSIEINPGLFATAGFADFQIQLYENDNHIEVHIAVVSQPLLLGGVTASAATTVCGLKNNTGSAFVGPSGFYNNGNWQQPSPIAFKFTPSGTATTYSWSPATFLTSTTGQSVSATNVIATQQYTVEAMDANGCTATSTTQIATYQPPASTNPSPDAIACAGSSSQIIASSFPPLATFSSTGPVTIPVGYYLFLGIIPTAQAANASPYPSQINVSNISPGATIESVTINGMTTESCNNLDIVLVSPSGQSVILMSDVDGNTALTGVTYTFKDGSPNMTGTPPPSGTYSCSNPGGGSDIFPPPGPGTITQGANPLLSSFTGDAVGNWKLYLRNDAGNNNDDGGTINSWSITFKNPTFGFNWTKNPVFSTSTLSVTNNDTTTVTINDTVTFVVIVTDPSLGCTSTASVTFNKIANPAPKLNFTDSAVCSNTPFIDLIVADSGAYSSGYPNNTLFEWINTTGGNYTPPTPNLNTFSINQPDNYRVVVILPGTVGGCFDTSNVANVSFGYQSPLPYVQQDSVNCNGGSDGIAFVDLVVPGLPPYNYAWYNSSNVLIKNTTTTSLSDSVTGLPTGWYKLHVTTNFGNPSPPPYCDAIDSVFVQQPDPLSVSLIQKVNVSCFGGNNGSIQVEGDGGSFSYSYLWNTGSTSNTVNGLAIGNYTVTVTDYHGCQANATYEITEPPLLTTGASSVPNICFGGSAGTATALPDGGTPAYLYAWSTSPVQTNSTATGLAAGTYTVTVNDSKGCSASATVEVEEPTEIIISKSIQHVLCKGTATASIDISVTGGTTGQIGYLYAWNNLAITEDISALTSGVYSVTVTDENGCTKTDVSTVTQPASVVIVSVAKVNVRCFGKATGTATANPTGGTSPYSYSWSNGGTTAGISNLTAGTYTVLVTDVNGCTKTQSAVITQNSNMVVIAVPSGPGTATASVSGGVAPYTYLWNSVPTQNTATATGLLPSTTYKVKVTDSKGCSVLALVTMPAPKFDNTGSDNSLLQNVKIYPNPNNGLFTLNFGNMLTESKCEIAVYNMSGQTLKVMNASLIAGNNEKTIDFSDLAKGIYQLKISVAGNTVIKRLIIE